MKRNIVFWSIIVASICLFWKPLRMLLVYSLQDGHQYDQYAHTLLIPFATVALVYFSRKKIFGFAHYSLGIGAVLLVLGLLLRWLALPSWFVSSADELLSVRIFGLVLCWIGGFVLCYGTRALQKGLFPLLFLFLTVPMPAAFLDHPVTAVQYGSTEVCSLALSLSGTPFYRSGAIFVLPSVSIEVAKECSGIHSTLALFIVSLLAAYLYLPSLWKKIVLVLSTIPIVCISNGLRIAGLTWLAEHVDPSFLYGNLHREGGMGFFLIAIALLFAILQLLRKGETRQSLRGLLAETSTPPLAAPTKSQ